MVYSQFPTKQAYLVKLTRDRKGTSRRPCNTLSRHNRGIVGVVELENAKEKDKLMTIQSILHSSIPVVLVLIRKRQRECFSPFSRGGLRDLDRDQDREKLLERGRPPGEYERDLFGEANGEERKEKGIYKSKTNETILIMRIFSNLTTSKTTNLERL